MRWMTLLTCAVVRIADTMPPATVSIRPSEAPKVRTFSPWGGGFSANGSAFSFLSFGTVTLISAKSFPGWTSM